jgi:hypothetical protein
MYKGKKLNEMISDDLMKSPFQLYLALAEMREKQPVKADLEFCRIAQQSIGSYADFCAWFRKNESQAETLHVAWQILHGFFQRPCRHATRISQLVSQVPWRYKLQEKAGLVEYGYLRWIDVSEAESLICRLFNEDRRGISLESIPEIEPAVLRVLAQLPRLRLNGLTTIPIEIAKILGRYSGELILDGLTELDSEIANEMCGNVRPGRKMGGLSLDGLVNPSLALVSALIKRPSRYLSLAGMTTLNDEKTASMLAKFSGELRISSVSEISSEAASVLAEYPGTLSLDGLTEICPEVARSLAKHKGMTWLDSIESLDDASALELGQGVGQLGLNGLEEISTGVARGLSSLQGDLWLGNMLELDGESAQSLGSVKGCLALDGIIEISPDVAKGLGQHVGGIRLANLMSLSPEVSKYLGKTQGELWLDGLSELPPETACGLRNHVGGLSLDHLSSISPSAAECLGSTIGFIRLDALRDCLPQIAKGFEQHQGNMSLKAVRSIWTPSAESLATVVGDIDFTDVREISMSVAEAFAPHHGTLYFTRLIKLDICVLQSLEKHRNGEVRLDQAVLTWRAAYHVVKHGCKNIRLGKPAEKRINRMRKFIQLQERLTKKSLQSLDKLVKGFLQLLEKLIKKFRA